MYKQIIINGIKTNYNIFDNGDCFNTKTNKFLSGSIKNNGYKMYNLTINGGKRKIIQLIVQLLYILFQIKINYSIVNHIDGNKLNNVVENLEWTNHSKNRQHSYDNNLCCKRGKQKKI